MACKRICIIGAGPCGMATLFHFSKMDTMPDVMCFEKQGSWGGQWNSSWRTGVDEHGEPYFGSIYKKLWTNGSKEMFELPDYTFDDHFGQATPSFVPKAAIRSYLEGRWARKAKNLQTFIQFNTVVRWVKYEDTTQMYTVTVHNAETGETREEIFTHIVVAVGIFYTPNMPEIPGIDAFQGRIIHSHDFRDASEYTGQRVLIVGAAYSGEDVALQMIKYRAKSIYLSYKTVPKSAICIVPKEIVEKPLVVRIDGNKACFVDGTQVEVDSIIYCTGYQYNFPFLESRFRLSGETRPYPAGLYNGTLFYKEGNNTLFYVGAMLSFYTFTYFDALAIWTCKYIMEQLHGDAKSSANMEADSKSWVGRGDAVKTETDMVNFQTSLIDSLVEQAGYDKHLTKMRDLLYEWIRVRKETLGLANYRDAVYKSVYTGTQGVKQTPFMQNYDESLETFLSYK